MFFSLIINITDRNKKQTEGVILFPQLLCKKTVYKLVLLPYLYHLCIEVYKGRVTHPSTYHMHVAYLTLI